MNIKVQTQADKFTLGDGIIKEYNPRERGMRALKIGAAFWGGAVVSVLVPVLHFVLVPGLFISGPIMAWIQYKQENQIHDAKITCPECKKDIEIKKISGNWPLKSVCPHCSAQMYLTKNV